MVFTRGKTAKQRLKIDWDAPTFRRAKLGSQSTMASRKPFSRAAALIRLCGTDKRPLLVLRECNQCAGSDFALLSRSMENDRTMLLTHWFHCVKLPASVRHKSHPMHGLFPGDNPPHLFFATADGAQIETLPGSQTQTQVWQKMTRILRKSYRSNPVTATKQRLEILNAFDILDAKESQVRRKLDREVERRGPKSSRFKQLKARFASLRKQRKALLTKERKASLLR